jgi:hypothetical protein
VRILTRENEELTSDALSVNGYQQYQAKDYRLVHAPFMGSSEKGGQWSSGDEPLYYIVSPKVGCFSVPVAWGVRLCLQLGFGYDGRQQKQARYCQLVLVLFTVDSLKGASGQ